MCDVRVVRVCVRAGAPMNVAASPARDVDGTRLLFAEQRADGSLLRRVGDAQPREMIADRHKHQRMQRHCYRRIALQNGTVGYHFLIKSRSLYIFLYSIPEKVFIVVVCRRVLVVHRTLGNRHQSIIVDVDRRPIPARVGKIRFEFGTH